LTSPSTPMTLLSLERPTFQEHLQSRVEVIEGRDVTLSCAASGGPGLTLSWYHNRVNITQLGSTGSGKYKIIHTTGDRTATSTLTLSQLRINDSGIIACIAMVTVFREDSQDVTPMMFTNFTVTSLVVLGKYYKHTIIKQTDKGTLYLQYPVYTYPEHQL